MEWSLKHILAGASNKWKKMWVNCKLRRTHKWNLNFAVEKKSILSIWWVGWDKMLVPQECKLSQTDSKNWDETQQKQNFVAIIMIGQTEIILRFNYFHIENLPLAKTTCHQQNTILHQQRTAPHYAYNDWNLRMDLILFLLFRTTNEIIIIDWKSKIFIARFCSLSYL